MWVPRDFVAPSLAVCALGVVALCVAAAARVDAVPQKGSSTRVPATTRAIFAMTRAMAGGRVVRPRYGRLVSAKSAKC